MEQVGRYLILDQLGRGAMGVVYLADDPVLHRKVAIKTVPLSDLDPKEREFLQQQLMRDARAAAALSHPNIVGVYDVFEQGDTAYLVMEYIVGETIAQRLKKGPVTPFFVSRAIKDMASALDYTHTRGIIHRDIKPANAMVEENGSIKIMDFGIARIADQRTSSPTGMVMGTVEYMAPEQIKGEPLDGKADQFSLAAVAYELLTGSTLFGRHTLTTLAYKLVNEEPPPARSHQPSLPPEVDLVLSKALSKNPAQRFATCSDFAQALSASLTGSQEVTALLNLPQQPILASGLVPKAVPGVATASLAIPVEDVPTRKQRRATSPGVKIARIAAFAAVAIAVIVVKGWHKEATPEPVSGSPVPSITEPAAPVGSAARKPVPETAIQNPTPIAAAPKQELKVKAPHGEPTAAEPPKVPNTKPEEKTAPPEVASVRSLPRQVEPPSSEGQPSGTPQVVSGPAFDALEAGESHLIRHDYNLAVESFNTAVRLKPDYVKAYMSRALAYQGLREGDLAIADYREVLRMHPQNSTAVYMIGLIHARQGKDDLAMKQMQRAIQIAPKWANPHQMMGVLLMRASRAADALKEFSTAIDLAPSFARAYEGRARAKRALGDDRGARQDMLRGREAIQQNSHEAAGDDVSQ